jgi:hypothetical protein
MSTTPVGNAITVLESFTSVNDTSEGFLTGVNDTGKGNLPSVPNTGKISFTGINHCGKTPHMLSNPPRYSKSEMTLQFK